MVACAPEQLDTLEPGLHLDKKFVCQAVEAVKHANWFEIEASGGFSRIDHDFKCFLARIFLLVGPLKPYER